MTRRHPPRPRGFALVVTLTLLPLMALLVIGLLSLSAVEIRRSSSEANLAVARANARLALILAIGQLQQHLGPDQRVAADASVAGKSAKSAAQPHWLSVWDTTLDDGQSPVIARDAEDGGLRDLRVDRSWDAASQRRTTLVSGNESRPTHADATAVAPEKLTELVGEGTLGTSTTGSVAAPTVALADAAGIPRGAYAWWIGDLGMLANLATPDIDPASNIPDHRALQAAQDASAQPFNLPEIPNSSRAALVTDRQFGLLSDPPAGDRAAAFHGATTRSQGLLTNVRDGGWKRDLTAFIDGNGNIPALPGKGFTLPGLSDSDPLVGGQPNSPDAAQAVRLEGVSPRYGLLRDWAQRASSAPLGRHSSPIEQAERAGRPVNTRNQNPVRILERTRTDLMPVLVESSIYYNLSYFDTATPDPRNPYGLRLHLYPRVVLWNPYAFDLEIPPSAAFLHINGNKIVDVRLQGGRNQSYRMNWGVNVGSSRSSTCGSMFFKLEGATLPPGQSMTWSPAANQIYDEAAFHNNLLTPNTGPSPTRAFYQDRRVDGNPLFQVIQSFPPKPGLVNNLLPAVPIDWREIVPPRPGGNVQSSGYTQADDYFMHWKPLGNSGSFSLSAFGSLPQGRFISCAYQYGDEDELPLEWSSVDPVPFPKSSIQQPTVSTPPDRRTRDGFRLRWFNEHPSNRIGSGSLANTPHLESAPIANWNMRASYSIRNPHDNVSDVTPHFFGIYTRDLFDGAVDWGSVQPRFSSGRHLGDPFDQPIRADAPRVLFDIPRRSAEIISLAAFQHVSFSEFIWQPTYALGNSLADPRVDTSRTEPRRTLAENRDKGGWNQDTIGYALDGRSDPNSNNATTREDNWAWHARALIQNTPLDHSVFFDLSYELNHALWDSTFLSSGSPAEKQALLDDPSKRLPNGRIRPNPALGPVNPADLADFHRAASHLVVDGAFNINSTSVEAWEALLLSGIDRAGSADAVAFPRILNPPGGNWDGKNPGDPAAWSGQRLLTRPEIRNLAERIVDEVRTRGPFLSLADFVNRRLRDDATGRKGTLQAAIDAAGINRSFESEWPIDNRTSLPDYRHPDHIKDPTRLEQTLLPETAAWGALGFLTQADVLQSIGPAITARSDTFRIRTCGEARDVSGKVTARAWCEAVIQRLPDYVDPADDLLTPSASLNETNRRFGRRFTITAFRWLTPLEV
jgi:hypothetical protein